LETRTVWLPYEQDALCSLLVPVLLSVRGI
jgi:hypothetical protein